MDELFKSCFLNWLEDPAYKLTHMSKKDKEYRIATSTPLLLSSLRLSLLAGGRFVTLVTPKDDWPIVFTGRHKKPAGPSPRSCPDAPLTASQRSQSISSSPRSTASSCPLSSGRGHSRDATHICSYAI